jgi:hypothetical protein
VNRPTTLFAIAAICLLVFAFASRWIDPGRSLVFNFRGKGYVFSVSSICIFMAALLSIFAAVYAFWIVPMKQNAGSWHFWLTTAGNLSFLG